MSASPPNSGHAQSQHRCLLSAKSGRWIGVMAISNWLTSNHVHGLLDFNSCCLAYVVLADGLAGDPKEGKRHEAEEGGDNQRPADALGRAQAQAMVEPVGEQAHGQRAETQADQVNDE